MELVLARHGQSQWQLEGERAGSDSALTETGIIQAQKLGAYLGRQTPFDAIYASTLQRARQTADIVSASLELNVIPEPDLAEFDDFENGWAPLPRSIWDSKPMTAKLNPGYLRFRTRTALAIRRLTEEHQHKGRVLIITHAGTIGGVFRYLFGSDTPRFITWNTATHRVEWQEHVEYGAAWALHGFNSMEHLAKSLRTY